MSLLDIRDVSKSFSGVKALVDVNLSVPEGSITALIGPNGAGKTTLFNAITGFARPDRGTITFGGRAIHALAPWQVARLGLTRSFQTAAGFPHLTVLENLMVAGASPPVESVRAALRGRWANRQQEAALREAACGQLDRMGLLGARDALFCDISAADMKLVEIARQLMMKPKLLLLDEPASGFGPDRLRTLTTVLRGLAQDGHTVLVIEHNLHFVLTLAERVYVLAAGRLIAQGDPSEVASDPNVINSYMGSSYAAA